MLITRMITVKSRVTSSFRSHLGVETQKAIREIDQEIQRVQADEVREQLQKRRDALIAKLKDITRLKDGQEVVIGQVEGVYDVRLGDLWPEVQSAEIVLEDGKVVSIREGKAESRLEYPREG